jgi:ABC-type multidrug transport system ATPase subunit
LLTIKKKSGCIIPIGCVIILQKSGCITYNGHEQDQFCIQRASAYISQIDNHIAELTVRETFDFANRCQGSSDAGTCIILPLICTFSF